MQVTLLNCGYGYEEVILSCHDIGVSFVFSVLFPGD